MKIHLEWVILTAMFIFGVILIAMMGGDLR
jgi:hypothetical protein